jgi:ribonuclease HI
MAPCLRAGRVLEFFSEELDLKASFALKTFATVFQAEVYAIMACSDYCLRECMTGKTICICSDSRAALFSLSSHTVSSKLVLQCRNSLQELNIHNGVQLFWVPGHCGIIENEEADSLVGVGSKFSFCGPEPCLPIPRSLMTRVTKNGCQVIIFLTGIWIVDVGNPKFR